MTNERKKQVEILAKFVGFERYYPNVEGFENEVFWTHPRYNMGKHMFWYPFTFDGDYRMIEDAVVAMSGGGVQYSWKYIQTYENGYKWSADIFCHDLLWACSCRQDTRLEAGCLAALAFVKRLPR